MKDLALCTTGTPTWAEVWGGFRVRHQPHPRSFHPWPDTAADAHYREAHNCDKTLCVELHLAHDHYKVLRDALHSEAQDCGKVRCDQAHNRDKAHN